MDQMKTYSSDVPLYVTNPVFQLVSVLLIIDQCTNNRDKTAGIGRIMIYMWGLGSKTNLLKLITFKQLGHIDDIPMIAETQIVRVLRQCINDGYIRVTDDGLYDLTSLGKDFLIKLENTLLYKDILADLIRVGKLPESKVKQLSFNWYAEI